ncbi:MAG: hypothetical protein AAF517_02045 [Planctomycetota bacterium]
MAMSTDVNLPKSHPAEFPDACVRCGEDPESNTLRIWTHSIGWWTIAFFLPGRGFSVKVPACSNCGWRIRLQRVGGTILTLAITILFLFFVWPHIKDSIHKEFQRWAGMGLILLALSPLIFWEVFFAPAIGLTAYSDSVDYEFRDPDYANEFADLNSDAEWVKVE